MAIVINDLEGDANANSFCSLEEANDYFESKFTSGDWTVLSDDNKKRYILKASGTIDSLNTIYDKAVTTQGLKFPLLDEESTSSVLPLQDMIVTNPISLTKFTKLISLETGIASIVVTHGGYYDPSLLIKPSDWSAAGNVYTHTPGAQSDIEISIPALTIADGDTVSFKLTTSGITAGSLEAFVGTLSSVRQTITADGENIFTLTAENTDKIVLRGSSDFNGSVTIDYIRQTADRYLDFALINATPVFGAGKKYRFTLVSISGGSLVVHEGDSMLEPLSAATSFERLNTNDQMRLHNADFADITFSFKIEYLSKMPSSIDASKATLKQIEYLLRVGDLLDQAEEDGITRNIKEHGHHGYEKKITNMSYFQKYGPGVLGTMKPWVDVSTRLNRI